MKQDLDAIMEERNLDALLVTGGPKGNPAMYYFTGDVHMHQADLVKIRGQEPALFYHSSMEREEAAKTGLKARGMAEFNFKELMKEAEGDMGKAVALRYSRIFSDLGINKGRVGLYGQGDVGSYFGILSHLAELLPEIELVSEIGRTVFGEVMETKDEEEVARIREMGRITVDIVGKVAAYIQSHKAKDGVLVKEDGSPLLTRDIKNNINAWVIEAGVENPHDCIFAIGREAAIPHSVGNLDDPMELGKTIVFDIFLQEPRGGYHYDFTRTWCIGHAPEEEQKMYDQVREVFDDLMGGLEANAPFNALQEHTNDLFEEMGHPTSRSHPGTEEGYVHGIGHGLGLNIHEFPASANKEATLKPGVVVTIEPGLYYPNKGMGVRIEDTVYVHQDGTVEVLAEYPHDLVLEIEEA